VAARVVLVSNEVAAFTALGVTMAMDAKDSANDAATNIRS
jgi:hypothetical protein